VGEKSAVAKASSKSPSVRTTVPEKIAKEMELRVGDILDWEIGSQSGRTIARVKKLS